MENANINQHKKSSLLLTKFSSDEESMDRVTGRNTSQKKQENSLDNHEQVNRRRNRNIYISPVSNTLYYYS